MKKLMWTGILAGTVAFGVSGPVASHHSHAMFDYNQLVSITGTVTKFSFRNPHVYLYVDVEEESGGMANYSVEMSNLPNMIRRGIGLKTFQPGDVITVNMNPLRDGRPGGNYTTVVAADGKTYD
ncbi:MAG: DUF6152 family protein [Gammaproteobacteria bacterium]